MTKKIWLVSILIFIVFLISFLTVFELRYNDKFFPRLSIDGQYVGGKSYEEVLSFFKLKSDFIYKNGFKFNIETLDGIKEITVPAFFNGMTTDQVTEYFSLGDFKKVIEDVYNVGKHGSLWQRINDRLSILLYDRKFQFTFFVRKDLLENYVSNELSNFLIKSEPAYFKYKNNKIIIVKEIIGEKIDASEFTKIIYEKLSLLDVSESDLKTKKDIPFVTENKLEPFVNLVDQLTSSIRLKLNYKNYSWTIKKEVFLSWLTLKNDNTIGVNKQKIKDYIDKNIASSIDDPVQNSRFGVQDNKLIELSVGKPGNVVDVEKISKNIESNIESFILDDQKKENSVVIISIDTILENPTITKDTIMQYNIRELVGSATTELRDSSLDRKKNIKAGVSKLNGILLAPGEEFSAVNAIGRITAEEGFVKENIIINGETRKELGGGLCQVATTLFRLALDAGLPITERANHRYVVSYYGPGLDATIYGPHPDLRFLNDTKNYLLLQGSVDDTKVILEFYGVKDGRLVEISEPVLYNWISPPDTKYIPTEELPVGKIKCTEVAHKGVTAETKYTVTYPNGQIKETNFKSVYQPWQKVCLLGIATK